jgi:ribonuclease HII
MNCPDIDMLSIETRLWDKGYTKIAGIDEAGRGPLAGPVVSACVLFDKGVYIEGVRDSKTLSESKRERLFDEIIKNCSACGVGIIDNHKIDKINIYEATKLAMITALEKAQNMPEYLLIDAMKLDIAVPNSPIIKGDAKSFTIAAASIIAKVTRDRIMRELDLEFPAYDWKSNKGYPTSKHREAIKVHGITPYHRRSFRLI